MSDATEPKKPDADQVARIILLMYGRLKNNNPFWIYVAVKPSMYKDFQAAQKDGSIDLLNFEKFGELIVSGEGQTPPDEITLKVAQLYQTDPSKFFTPMDPEAEVQKRVDEAAKNQNQGE